MSRVARISWILGIILGGWICGTIVVAAPSDGWLPFGITTDRLPVRSVSFDQAGRTVLDITIPGMEITHQDHHGVAYQQISLPYGGVTHEIGRPALPLITELVAIPDRGEVRVRVLEVETTIIPDVNVYPFLEPPLRDGSTVEPTFVLDKEIYQGRKSYPSEWVRVAAPVIWRDVRLAPVIIQPARWNPETKEMTVATRMRIEVITDGEGGTSVKDRRSSKVSARFARMYQDRVINWNSHSGGLDLSSEGSLLIITHPNFYNSMLPFANWKHQKGFKTTLISLDEIGDNPTNLQIKNFIRNAYYTWSTPPEYVILVGDYNFVPWWNGLSNSKTDHIYSMLEGDDFLPDVVMGRFSVETAAECDILVSKLVNYEHNPYLVETGWYDAGMVVASNEGVDPENGLKVRQMLLDAEFSIVDLFQQPVSNQVGNLVNALNDGRSWVFYIGHGNATSWASTSPYFTTSHIASLTNGRKLPAIVSIACLNADLDYPSGDCFAETWMTTASDRGAANVFAFTESCVFYYSDTLGLGIMRSHFEEGTPFFGNNVDYGRVYMFQSFPEGPGGTCERTMQQAILVGDPTQLVWSDQPGTMVVNHPSSIQIGPCTIPITVTRNGSPVAEAMVCAMLESQNIYEVGVTNGAGMVTLSVVPQSPGGLQLTVTSENALPYETIISVSPPSGPYILYNSYAIDDSLQGNGNSRMDLGETITLDLMLNNIGIEPANNVHVLLRTLNSHVTFIDSTEDFGTILAGGSVTQFEGFSLHAGTALSDSEEIGIEVIIAIQGGLSWTSVFSITSHAPDLLISGITINDRNINGRLDPGETADVMVDIKNDGSSNAPDVYAVLTSDNPLITIQSGFQNLGQIPSSGTAHITFSVTAAPTLPNGTSVAFNLNLQASNGYAAELPFSEFVGQMVAYLWDPDLTPISGSAVGTILTGMGLTYETGTTLPISLDQYASVWAFLGMWNNNHVLTGSEGASLARYLDDGGALYMEGGDTWAYDLQTEVHSYFYIIGVNDGWSDLTSLSGISGTMTQGLVFGYQGENSFVDRIAPNQGAQLIFNSFTPQYGTAVAYDQGTYKTIGASFELGGLSDGNTPNTKANLVQQYLTFFQVIDGEDLLPPIISHNPISNQSGVLEHYSVQAVITDGSGVAEARVHYSVNGEDFPPISMTTSGNGIFEAEIPAQTAGSVIQYYIDAVDAAPATNTISTAIHSLLVLLPNSQVELISYDFEENNGQLMVSSGSDWQWGIPASGPPTAHSGTKVWGTNLVGQYFPNSSSSLDTPPIDLRNVVSPLLTIWHWYSFESSGNHLWDGGNIKVSMNGGPFQVLSPVGGYDGILDNTANPLHGESVFGTIDGGNYWHQTVFDLTSVAGNRVVIRFHMGSDGTTQAPGWFIDDLTIQGSVFGPPTAIDDLSIKVVNNDVHLRWSPSSMAYEYRVYRSPDPNFTIGTDSYIGTTAFSTYCDQGALLQGNSFFYKVIAISEYGVQGPQLIMIPRQQPPLDQQSPQDQRSRGITQRNN